MGILDFLGGLGQAGAAPWTQRLSSGLGHPGGFLQSMGLGKYGQQQTPGMGSQMGQKNNFVDFLHTLGQGLQGQQPDGQPPQPQGQPPQQQPPPGQQTPGLAALVQQWMQQNQRQ
jgi:hypothetical protein